MKVNAFIIKLLHNSPHYIILLYNYFKDNLDRRIPDNYSICYSITYSSGIAYIYTHT